MAAPYLLSLIAFFLTLVGVNVLTLVDSQLTLMNYISRLNEVNATYQAYANGLFFLIGIFWMGSINTIRRTLEPKQVDSWLMYSAIAFAASYILSVVFPCDEGCPPVGSANQMIHNTLVWVLYAGPAVFAGRVMKLQLFSGWPNYVAKGMLAIFFVMQIDSAMTQFMPGIWQRIYDIGFCGLWWLVLVHYQKR